VRRCCVIPLDSGAALSPASLHIFVMAALRVAFVVYADLGLGGAAGIIREAAERHAVLVRNDVMQERLGALEGQTLDGLARLARVLNK
jgi:hypothetical protein